MGLLRERIAKNIIKLRESKGLSLNAFARLAKMNASHLFRVEKEHSWPSEATILQIATALGVDPAVLFASEIPDRSAIITDRVTAEKILDALGLRETMAELINASRPPKKVKTNKE